MGQLGYIGYGVYRINDKALLVFNPRGPQIFHLKSSLENIFDHMVEGLEEEDCYLDYKINTNWNDGVE
jgi:hypothetical protein